MLNSFGAILSYAIELEARLRDYYQTSGNAERVRDAEKRKSNLERMRRENVTEIKLEPIDGLDEADYVMNLGDASPAGQSAIEGIAVRFYSDVAPKINVREVQRTLERCAKQYQGYSE
jgi:hypothetical protein